VRERLSLPVGSLAPFGRCYRRPIQGRCGHSSTRWSLADAPAKFSTWLEFEVAPVLDIADNVAVNAAGAEFRESI
jgi:hypothetical protein